jgi:hypothetical protein
MLYETSQKHDPERLTTTRNPMKTYTLTLTEAQAQTLSRGMDIIARLGIGQFRDALEQLPLVKDYAHGWHDDMDVIGLILAKYTIDGVNGWNSSLGIHHNKVSESTRIAWDLYQVVRNRLAWDWAIAHGIVKEGEQRKWPEMMQVHYDEPSKVSNEPLAKIS